LGHPWSCRCPRVNWPPLRRDATATPRFARSREALFSPSLERAGSLLSALSRGAVVPTSKAVATYLQGDWCDPSTAVGGFAAVGTIGALLLPSLAESGRVVVYPYTAPGVDTLFIEEAFYKPGVPSQPQRSAVALSPAGSTARSTSMR